MTQRDEGHNYRDSKNKAMEYERKQKYEAIIDMVIRWLDTNIDDNQKSQNELFFDSYELKEKINLALDPSTTKREIEDGDL
ncbi:hypothetical protein OAP46_00385 [bacterium]|jgi:hypothetical protein|nr:hypothetical protein [bacterium]|tara:strand:+ start:687 stop:929 length:243 start_codon:yes stop_codon:yes gene_type:complete